MSENNELKVTWGDFEYMVDQLCEKIPYGKYDTILALACGGLIPSYYIAKKLGVRVVETLSYQHYDENNQQGERVIHHSSRRITKNFSLPLNGVLVVDDIADSGRTIQQVRELAPNVHVATLFKKKDCPVVPSYFVQETDKWVIFPWEYSDPSLFNPVD